MRKIALSMLVAALSLGFVGCAGSLFKNPWNMPDPDQATVAEVWIGDENEEGRSVGSYVVVLEQRDRFVIVVVDKATFESVHEGDKVEIELISVTSTEDNRYILEVEYCWHVGKQDFQVIFKWDATKRPVRPGSDSDKS